MMPRPPVLAFLLLFLPVGQAAGLTLEIPAGSEPEIVFDHERDACAPSDVPDVPARAFRAADGSVRLIASHWTNRGMSGPSLNQLRHSCDVLFTAAGNDDPAAHDDRGWIVSTYTLDGITIHALVHNEFHGHKRPALCPSGRYMDCWYNTITYAVSIDGGRNFKRPPGAGGYVAGVPYRFDPTQGQRSGLFNPSNIIRRGDYFYTMVTAAAQNAQKAGVCLLRTDRLDDPSAWRAWGGEGFTVAFADPYGTRSAAAPETCRPIPGLTRLMASLSFHRPSGLYVGLFIHRQRPTPEAEPVDGVYYATSPDLVTWSQARLLYPSPTTLNQSYGTQPVAYPSLLDPDSPSRNFEDTDGDAFMYLTRITMKGWQTGWSRDLNRLPVRFSE
jgi:hypothetical protein